MSGAYSVAVIGAGGVGGYLAVRLAQGGCRVHVVARGDHLRAMQRDGVALESISGDARLPVRAQAARAGDQPTLSFQTPPQSPRRTHTAPQTPRPGITLLSLKSMFLAAAKRLRLDRRSGRGQLHRHRRPGSCWPQDLAVQGHTRRQEPRARCRTASRWLWTRLRSQPQPYPATGSFCSSSPAGLDCRHCSAPDPPKPHAAGPAHARDADTERH